MAGENTLNYEQQGGDTWTVGGTLQVAAGGKMVPASGTQAGPVTAAAAAAGNPPTQAEFNALVTKFNALLAACQGVGITT